MLPWRKFLLEDSWDVRGKHLEAGAKASGGLSSRATESAVGDQPSDSRLRIPTDYTESGLRFGRGGDTFGEIRASGGRRIHPSTAGFFVALRGSTGKSVQFTAVRGEG